MKKCPYCAEDIKEEAIVCRYCGKELQPISSSPETSPSKPIEAPQPKTLVFILSIVLVLALSYVNYYFSFYDRLVSSYPTITEDAKLIVSAKSVSQDASKSLAVSDTIIMYFSFAVTFGISKLFSSKSTYKQLAFLLGGMYAVTLLILIVLAIFIEGQKEELSIFFNIFFLIILVLNVGIVSWVGKIRWWQSLIATIPGYLFQLIQEIIIGFSIAIWARQI